MSLRGHHTWRARGAELILAPRASQSPCGGPRWTRWGVVQLASSETAELRSVPLHRYGVAASRVPDPGQQGTEATEAWTLGRTSHMHLAAYLVRGM